MPEPKEPTPKRFSEKQVAKILRRASEIQQSDKPSLSADGIGAKELVEIGSELGLDRAAIRQAIDEAQASESAVPAALVGPIRVEESITLGAALDSELWEALTADLRHAFGRAGKTSKVGEVYEWSGGDNELDSIHVSALPVDGKTKLRITSSMDNLLALNIILGGLFSLIATAMVLSKSPLPIAGKMLTVVLFLTCILGVVRWLFLGACRRRQAAIQRVLAKAQTLFEPELQAVGSERVSDVSEEGLDQRLQS